MANPLVRVLQGRFMKHPLHPMLAHFPVGLWVFSFVFDIIYLINGNPDFAVTSYYCMMFGILSAALAVFPGFADYLAIPRDTQPKRIATTHLILNVGVTVLFLLNLVSRSGIEAGAPSLVTRGQFILSFFSIILLGISGYLGGLLVYNHGIGFKPHLRDREEVSKEGRREEEKARRAA